MPFQPSQPLSRVLFAHRSVPLLLGTVGALLLAPALAGQALVGPLEMRPTEIRYNAFLANGMPISSNADDPGSDGRGPTLASQEARGLTLSPPTAGQFKSFISFGSIVRARPTVTPLPTPYGAYAANALPRATDGVETVYLVRAHTGVPYLSRRASFQFGSVVRAPEFDINGDPLPPGVAPEDYWIREPYSTNNHANALYYWSPHARSVFAIRTGPLSITWRRAAPENPQPASLPPPGDPDYVVVNGLVHAIRTEQYIVSSGPAKTPRRMYWTEGTFRATGIIIDVPEGITTNFIYTDAFPKTVDEAYVPPGSSPPVLPEGSDGIILSELRTIYFNADTGYIHAYNHEGRILLELLGDFLDSGRQAFLGVEIVDVVRQVNPADVVVELGEKLTAWQDAVPDDSHLLPAKLNRAGEADFVFDHFAEGRRLDVYAVRETKQLNDFLMHWTEEGLEGIQWPFRFIRYKMVWPTDVTRYSHYMRPTAATEEDAKATAVVLPTANLPIIAFQDPLDKPRAKLTETLAFYTWLDATYPAHRTLIRYTSGEEVAFERIFSWHADSLTALESGNVAASAALRSFIHPTVPAGQPRPPPILDSWDPVANHFAWAAITLAPRIVTPTVFVGQRIGPPSGLTHNPLTGTYWAGHIREEKGDSFQLGAYIDPLAAGFPLANTGAIIPVNAIPGSNQLEVWWFRSNGPDLAAGFRPVYWPSVIGRYTLAWPEDPREIVLASNAGSGALSNRESAGRIYYQNNPALPGYNPNEEHALMTGGQAYALRDDLNIVSGTGYSSEPFVLVAYEAADGRPAMATFKVLREKPEAGHAFDYVVEAGTILQPPMPLGLLPPPVEGTGANAVNFNEEPPLTGGDLPTNWNPGIHDEADFAFRHYQGFTFRDRKESFWVYRGPHAGPPDLAVGTYDAITDVIIAPLAASLDLNEVFQYTLHASHPIEALRVEPLAGTVLPIGYSINGLTISGLADSSVEIPLLVSSIMTGESVEITFKVSPIDPENPQRYLQSAIAVESINPYTGTTVTHIGRPPHLAVSPTASNSFTMRFYYKTLEGFAWPGISSPPSVGSIVPYLRLVDPEGGFLGDPDKSATDSLDIVYRPTWPVDTPKMALGDTLTLPKQGLPAVRGQTSLQILYDQNIAADIVAEDLSVILHDSTREKVYSLGASGLDVLPDGVRRESYQGRLYFPDLPPHLVERLFFDPNRGEHGQLVFRGEFKDELFGEKYLLLNVLRGADLATVQALCPDGDQRKTDWNAAVAGLSARVETFRESTTVPGTYIPLASLTRNVGIGAIVEIDDHDTAVDSYALSASGPGSGYITLVAGGGAAFSPPAEPVSLHVIQIIPELHPGEMKVIEATNPLNEQLTLQHTVDVGGRFDEYEYEWLIAGPVDGLPPDMDESMSQWLPLVDGLDLPRYTLGGADVRTLSDNYLVMRYRPVNPEHPLFEEWSPWTRPQLAEGWIKRVLAGINPFRQRITDLFNNQVDTNVSLLTQAGRRWEGDIALNLENINSFGLIEIYETVLNRGRMLSIDAGINYGPANDALLLAAGYLNDLYMFVGNEALADAANPTIGIGTADATYGDIATSLFAFRGQVATLLEEELALLRGRDDFLLPGTQIAPVYNRLVWNYTRGIDAGEVIYALNYNIQEKPDGEPTGIIDASDAARMFPQGHGDAYGHYLTAVKNYYSLFMSGSFDWVPRIEAVLVLGQPVSVDYFDERKFAAAAGALARTGLQVFDLTWRQNYRSGPDNGWERFGATRANSQRGTERHWGLDHWATRTGQGGLVNWMLGNAILPDADRDPTREGIQKIDRSTVPELIELAVVSANLQTSLDNAENRLTPLGLPDNAIAFDINPAKVTGADPRTHFEQIYDRALVALNNAVASFDDAKDITRLMRAEQDSLATLQNQVAEKEFAFRNALIDLYGTPYPDDIGPGRTYRTGYDGPDLLHYMYVDLPRLPNDVGFGVVDEPVTFKVDLQGLPDDWGSRLYDDFNFNQTSGSGYLLNTHFVEYELGPHGFFGKPGSWTGKRYSPGRIQQAISEVLHAHNALAQAFVNTEAARVDLDAQITLFNTRLTSLGEVKALKRDLLIASEVLDGVKIAFDLVDLILERKKTTVSGGMKALQSGLPLSFIAGLAAGGDITSPVRGVLEGKGLIFSETIEWLKIAKFIGVRTFEQAVTTSERWVTFDQIDPKLRDIERKGEVVEIASKLRELEETVVQILYKMQALDDAERNYRALVASGDTILEEREIFRRRAAGLVQGYRTRDAAFRIFRNEKLERYKTLFDLAARYTYIAAQAYDYETGLLHTPGGRSFIDRIVAARALGVVSNGQPQFAGSNTGDPGLSSVLAEMAADWSVLRGRLGFNNPDGYGTTVSLRRENHRVYPGERGDTHWQQILEQAWRPNVLDDPDVRHLAMQLGTDGLPVPGFVFTFGTTISPARNLFGRALGPGDHAFSASSFATKIFAAGVALEGYIGMSDPGSTTGTGGTSPDDPDAWWLHPDALAATPYVYLIPVGVDAMRSPPLGDVSTIRRWNVNDVAVPLPFNIGASDFSTKQWWLASDFLSEPLFAVRKHQAFRPVSSPDVFSFDIYSGSSLSPSQFTNSRLIGRSVWNSEWKLVIPAETLLADRDEAVRRFIRSVRDIHLHFVTYSYSGN